MDQKKISKFSISVKLFFLKNYILNFVNTSNMEITTMDIIKTPTKLKKELKISYNSSGISDDL